MQTDQAIKNRKTQKILANEPWPISTDINNLHFIINELLDLAATAPYHHRSNEVYSIKKELKSCVPWRFYVLDTKNCRLLLEYISKQNIKAGKITNMLASADALLLTTWLPEPTENNTSTLFNGSIKNMEHIAAVSAAIQNVLIGATARNIPNYWSSGGVLRKEQLNKYLGIPINEILLGALFLFPKYSDKQDVIIKPGALRNKGKEKNTWSNFINIADRE